MPNIVEISDFNGTSQLQQDTRTQTKFNHIRDEYSSAYIYKLLGAELGGLFLTDLDGSGVPQAARFLCIYNAFQEDYDGYVVVSEGIKFYIKNIVWFFFARDNTQLITTSGNTVKKGENSDVSNDSFFLVKNYNKAIETGIGIQWYINNNLSDYPEYNGQPLRYASGL